MIFTNKEDFTYIALASNIEKMKLAVYIIKVRNLQEADKLELVRQEREMQIRLVESVLVNELDKR
jgi:hypothetical protein